MEETKLSGDTETKKETPVAPEEPKLPETHYQWRERIKEESLVFFPEKRIFEEYDPNGQFYEFYYYDLDYQPQCILLKKKDIETIHAFMKKQEAEDRWKNKLND